MTVENNHGLVEQMSDAFGDGDEDRLIEILSADPSLASGRHFYGYAALHLAAVGGHTRLVRRLLDLGLSPSQHGAHRRTPLHRAAEGFEASLPSMLVLAEAGASVDARDTYGNSPLMTAATYSNAWAVAFLLGRRADLHLKNRRGLTASDLIGITYRSALRNRKKYRQQIRECELIIGMFEAAL